VIDLHSSHPYLLSPAEVSVNNPIHWIFDTPLPAAVIPGSRLAVINKKNGQTLSVGYLSIRGTEIILTKVYTERFGNNSSFEISQLVALIEGRNG
jgi:hypothetical protein